MIGRHTAGPRAPLWMIGLVVVITLLVAWIIWGRAAADREATVARDNASVIAEQVRAACARQGPTARELGDLCQRAEQVAAQPGEPVPGPPGEQGEPGRPPTDAEVFAAVDRVLRDRGVDVPASVVAVEVAAHLSRNPPPAGEDGQDGQPGPPGEPPTAAQIRTAVDLWFTENAELVRGPAGPEGERGPGPTPEQLADALAAWFQENPLPTCPEGTEPRAVTLLTVEEGPREAVVCVVLDD